MQSLILASLGFAFAAVLLAFPQARAGESGPLDYAVADHWLSNPAAPSKAVDVFYVYPTIYAKPSPVNMDVNDPALRATARRLLKSQAGVYSPSCNLYAPFYRQMSIAGLTPDGDLYASPAFRKGAEDVAAAFRHYIEHLNPDRPFLLAGHSQGSMALIDLMRHQFDNPDLQKRLVAAYLIGYSITGDDLKQYPWMRPATGARDTGVIVSFNTQAPDATGSPVLLPGAICINPLTWTTDDTPASRRCNLGAVFFDDDGACREVPCYAGARINLAKGALETTPPSPVDAGGFPEGVYHRYDYAFWFRNLEKNVKVRIQAYRQAIEKGDREGKR